ncbi:CPBP family intramembrane metalloprotease [Fulvivirga sp. M361]|uniref:CPBP family glutamic-type intramembrane protease n=1 Tax=Fulvivirga sp. M361 TaxID=2594266 RepID=UPI001179996C|nr:CPBP family glutamic-type intramembrane protease [Fulvivirga sp. M361]TRX60863.1 CPBP family intramembrane metalloprotease [Fulvivirga sp. M361]
MKEILKYLKKHLKEDFQWDYYIAITLFLVLCISVNYYLDFEDSILDSYYGQNIRIFYFFLFYGFAYYGATFIAVIFKKQKKLLGNPWFWVKSAFILFIIALDGAFHHHNEWVRASISPQTQYFVRKVLGNFINIMTMLVPLILFYKWHDRRLESFYGLSLKGFNYRPYVSMLLIMMVLIGFASFIDNFSDFYPMYKSSLAHTYFNVQEWVLVLIYELAYGWNFLTIELAFRGFMILSLFTIMGRNAVIPMVVTYCFYHFGKPAGEAISSIAGGYILGVIALESRSILGGVMIHIGVAWLMELFAWLQQKLF